MRILLVLAGLIICFRGNAQTAVPDADNFGARNDQGVYQQVHVKPFSIDISYFTDMYQQLLIHNAKDQVQYNIWPARRHFGGVGVEIDFQDGALKSRNPDAKLYSQLDTTKTYAVVHASLAKDEPSQVKTEIYHVGGVVTLIAAMSTTSAVLNGPGKGYSDFEQSVFLNSKDAVRPDQIRVSKNDFGPVWSIGVVSHEEKPISVGQLRQAMGQFVEVIYP